MEGHEVRKLLNGEKISKIWDDNFVIRVSPPNETSGMRHEDQLKNLQVESWSWEELENLSKFKERGLEKKGDKT